IGEIVVRLQLFQVLVVDAADISHHMRCAFTSGILAEQASLDLHARKAITVGGKTRNLDIRQAGAYRQASKSLALLAQLLEAPAIPRPYLDDSGKLIDEGIEIGSFARHDFKGVSRVVVRQHFAVAVEDQAPVGY